MHGSYGIRCGWEICDKLGTSRSLIWQPVQDINSRALGAPAAQEGLASPQDRVYLGLGGHTSLHCVQSLRKEVFCCLTSGCKAFHTYSSVGLCWEQEGEESDFPYQISRKTKSDSGKGWTQTQRVCTITAVIHIVSLLLFSHCSLGPADAAAFRRKPQGTSGPAPEVQQCPGLQPQASHTPVKNGYHISITEALTSSKCFEILPQSKGDLWGLRGTTG